MCKGIMYDRVYVLSCVDVFFFFLPLHKYIFHPLYPVKTRGPTDHPLKPTAWTRPHLVMQRCRRTIHPMMDRDLWGMLCQSTETA